MFLIAFDVDDTLNISEGPIHIDWMTELLLAGHAVGICGNWPLFVKEVDQWYLMCSFFGPINESKAEYLTTLKHVIEAERYIMIGNYEPDFFEALQAGWEFMTEHEGNEWLKESIGTLEIKI